MSPGSRNGDTSLRLVTFPARVATFHDSGNCARVWTITTTKPNYILPRVTVPLGPRGPSRLVAIRRTVSPYFLISRRLDNFHACENRNAAPSVEIHESGVTCAREGTEMIDKKLPVSGNCYSMYLEPFRFVDIRARDDSKSSVQLVLSRHERPMILDQYSTNIIR